MLYSVVCFTKARLPFNLPDGYGCQLFFGGIGLVIVIAIAKIALETRKYFIIAIPYNTLIRNIQIM